ncbi:NYN domain-containing protein [Nocardia cyriacigeorgica]|uniref:NYN domain-containing protein n=1 Tax=Nocardia cyriacigeorgica TaxID=135487 RepID=UPI002490D8BE|nr:NYN domain-containing protein [Nocardia cyriacigeorgica]BDU04492.1 hypothetical protein FMUBM48_07550 [Nocardia cyriacigeorgica]
MSDATDRPITVMRGDIAGSDAFAAARPKGGGRTRRRLRFARVSARMVLAYRAIAARRREVSRNGGGARRRRVAVLIDADALAADKVGAVLAEASTYGDIYVNRAYQDWTSTANWAWRAVFEQHGVQPVHVVNQARKNSVDIALVVDAMDLLHTSPVDYLCLVASDGDFTALVSRFRYSGISVVGFGYRSASRQLIRACGQFRYVEELPDPGEAADPPVPTLARAQLRQNERLKDALINAAMLTVDNDGWSSLAQMSNLLHQRFSDFHPRSFGYKNFKQLLEATGWFVMQPSAPGDARARLTDAEAWRQTNLRNNRGLITALYQAWEDSAAEDGWAVYDQFSNALHRDLSFSAKAFGFTKATKLVEATGLFDIRRADSPASQFKIKPLDSADATKHLSMP